jgi:hypothetical protein
VECVRGGGGSKAKVVHTEAVALCVGHELDSVAQDTAVGAAVALGQDKLLEAREQAGMRLVQQRPRLL